MLTAPASASERGTTTAVPSTPTTHHSMPSPPQHITAQNSTHLVHIRAGDHDDHAHPHVEGAEHLRLRHLASLQQRRVGGSAEERRHSSSSSSSKHRKSKRRVTVQGAAMAREACPDPTPPPPPACRTSCTHWKSGGISQVDLRMRAARPLGTTRGMFSGKPPPVMCTNPRTSAAAQAGREQRRGARRWARGPQLP